MKCIYKLKGNEGFTLAETLLAVLILLLVSGIVATGIPVAQNVYEKVVLGANAQVMLSTAVDALKSEVGTSWKVKLVDDKNISYFSAGTGWETKMMINESVKDEKTNKVYYPIMIKEYVDMNDFNTGAIRQKEHSLVPDKSSKLYVHCDKIYRLDDDNNKDVIVFYNIQVRKKSDDSPLAVLDKDERENKLEIRVISGDIEK